MQLRTVVLGAGGIAKPHFEALSQHHSFVPVAVADIHLDRAREYAELYGVKAYDDYKRMVEEQQPDVAVITLPHFLHKEAALSCIEHGCHILLEKPMAMNTAECDEIIAAASRKNVQLMVGHTQHYIASNLKAKEIMEQEDLGELVMVNDCRHGDYFRASRPDWFLTKKLSGGGIMMNLGSHSIDKIQWLTGSRFRSVKAKLSYKGNRGDVEGSGLIYLESTEGVPVTISQAGYYGIDKDETEFIYTKGCIRLRTSWGVTLLKSGETIDYPHHLATLAQPFELQYDELSDAIQDLKPLTSTGEYARSIIRLVEAVYESDRTGREVVVVTDR